MDDVTVKLAKLTELLRELGSVVIGFSGGADSAFLATAAYRVLEFKSVAVTCCSGTLPETEKRDAMEIARQIGIKHVFLQQNELDSEEFVRNDSMRCYYCKKGRFEALSTWAGGHGYQWVLEGSNADDVGDFRPGMRAVEEMGRVRSPLLEIGFTKAEIREISQQWGLSTWNKPSAACLSSRVAYGLPITVEKLAQIEQAEMIIKEYCKGQVRVRHHGNLARIEVDKSEIGHIANSENGPELAKKLRTLGFTFVTVDLNGYQTGSMNQLLTETERQ